MEAYVRQRSTIAPAKSGMTARPAEVMAETVCTLAGCNTVAGSLE